MRFHRVVGIGLAAALLAAAPGGRGPAFGASPPPPDLPEEYRQWLETVSLLITDEEREFFLALEENFRRDAFVREFWEVRDPEPRTPYNELEMRWLDRAAQALEDYGSLEDDRSRFLLLVGEPGGFILATGQEIDRCWEPREELEIWFYGPNRAVSGQPLIVIFFRPRYRSNLPYRAWLLDEALVPDLRYGLPSENPADFCADDLRRDAMLLISRDTFYRDLVHDLMQPPEPRSREWLDAFAAATTDPPPGVETFDVGLDLAFPGRNQNRTVVQGLIAVPPEAVAARELEGRTVHDLLLVGEVIRDDRLFESFRYEFELPPPPAGQPLSLVFRRSLRPGEVEMRVKVEDLFGQRFAHARRRFEVPPPGDLESLRRAPDSPYFRLLAEADAAAERGRTSVRLIPPEEGEIQLGYVRFAAAVTGEVDRVTFLLDGRPIMSKREPPYSVELDLGRAAAEHRLRVIGYDAEGREVAADELPVNRGGQRFRVRLIEPRPDRTYEESLSVVVEAEVPDGETLDRIEIFHDENRIATLYQEPFTQPLLLDSPELAYIRAVGYLEDGSSTEAVVFINAPDYFEHVEVQLVELYATVVGRRGRPLTDLGRDDFRVLEDGVEQRIRRFDYVRDLPIHAGLLIDVSASMEEELGRVTEAARSFLDQAVQPRDRAALISFADRPRVDVRFSNDLAVLGAALDGLRVRGTTALYDSLIFALHYFDGIKGPKALLLLSDGYDEASRFGFEHALHTARRAGVTLYAIGMKEGARDPESRRVLEELAAATGGRSFFIEDPSELPAIYASIQNDLRSQYLLVYQSTSDRGEDEFRRIEVRVSEKGAEVRTIAGYYP